MENSAPAKGVVFVSLNYSVGPGYVAHPNLAREDDRQQRIEAKHRQAGKRLGAPLRK
jgi:hypothetical protein